MQRRMIHGGRIRSAGYDERDQCLEVEFERGELRSYRGVPAEVARRFFESPNPATFWEDRIADEYPSSTQRDGAEAEARNKLDSLFGKP